MFKKELNPKLKLVVKGARIYLYSNNKIYKDAFCQLQYVVFGLFNNSYYKRSILIKYKNLLKKTFFRLLGSIYLINSVTLRIF